MASTAAKFYYLRDIHDGGFWARSSEHGCGWSDIPKQLFTKSEIVKEIAFMIENNFFRPVAVLVVTVEI